MTTLSIKQMGNRYVPFLNDQPIPLVCKCKIISNPGEMTKVKIEIVVASTDDATVIIEKFDPKNK